MPADHRFFKYLIVYPFNVLSICKITIIILLSMAIYCWDERRKLAGSIFVLAIIDILSIGTASVSLWFILQKFYWLKVETVFNIVGSLLSLASISISYLISLEPAYFQSYTQVTHFLTLIIWIFSGYWAWRETYNNVSNLFISEWGLGADSTEIEYLEQHF